jgi:heat shock protein HslJ
MKPSSVSLPARALASLVFLTACASGCGSMQQSSDNAAAPATGAMSEAEMQMDAAGGSKPLPGATAPAPTVAAAAASDGNPQVLKSSAVNAGLDPKSPVGINWVFIQADGYDGELPGDRPQPSFILSRENGRMAGSTGCNPMNAAFDLDVAAGTLDFRRLANGSGMCTGDMAAKEDAVTNALNVTDAFQLVGHDLVLLSKGNQVARLTNPAAQ